jgi:hypothetical protein
MKRLLMTGSTRPGLIHHAQSLENLSDCLIKPIKISRLRDALQAALKD